MSNRTRQDTRHRTRDATRQDTTAAVAVNANARAQLEAIRDEWLQPLVETIAQQAERIGHVEATGAAKDETIAALRRRAEVAEATLSPQRQAVREAPGVQEAPGGGQEAAPGVWARVRRWWGGT